MIVIRQIAEQHEVGTLKRRPSICRTMATACMLTGVCLMLFGEQSATQCTPEGRLVVPVLPSRNL